MIRFQKKILEPGQYMVESCGEPWYNMTKWVRYMYDSVWHRGVSRNRNIPLLSKGKPDRNGEKRTFILKVKRKV